MIAEDPKKWSAYYYLGQAYTQAGKAEQAVRVFEKAYQLQADNVNVMAALGQAARRVGRHQESLVWLRQGLGIDGTSFGFISSWDKHLKRSVSSRKLRNTF